MANPAMLRKVKPLRLLIITKQRQLLTENVCVTFIPVKIKLLRYLFILTNCNTGFSYTCGFDCIFNFQIALSRNLSTEQPYEKDLLHRVAKGDENAFRLLVKT